MVAVLIHEVAEVVDHPNADRLSLVKFDGHTCISAKLEDGTPRYKPGSKVIFVPEGVKVPEKYLKKGFWDEEKGKGYLGGENGDVVEARKVRGTLTEGILFSVEEFDGYDPDKHFVLSAPGTDVSALFEVPVDTETQKE